MKGGSEFLGLAAVIRSSTTWKQSFITRWDQGEFCVQHNFRPSGVFGEELEVDVPIDREVRLKSIQNVKFWKTGEGTRRIYHWKSENPEASRVIAVPYIPGRTPDVQVSSFSTWDEVGRWYSDLEKNHRVPTAEVKAKADGLTKGSKDALEKIEVLYNFAAKKIRYIIWYRLASVGRSHTPLPRHFKKGMATARIRPLSWRHCWRLRDCTLPPF